jgi:hypothetical protein
MLFLLPAKIPAQAELGRDTQQKRFYGFNVWSGHKQIKKLRYYAPQPSEADWWSDLSSGSGAFSGPTSMGRRERCA